MKIGDSASFVKTITKEEVAQFAELSGDKNPLHTSEEYAATTPFKKPIVHGMFLGALCSRLVGMYLPGEKCLYLSQELTFKKPVYTGDTVEVHGSVTEWSEGVQMATIEIRISSGSEMCATGTARVKLRS